LITAANVRDPQGGNRNSRSLRFRDFDHNHLTPARAPGLTVRRIRRTGSTVSERTLAQKEMGMTAKDMSAEAGDRSRTVTWKPPIVDPVAIASMSGLDYLQSLLDSNRPPPIAALLDISLTRIGPGVAVFSGTPAEYHYNPIGVVHGGFAATLLDSALGCAVHTTLKPGFAYTTVELKVNYVRPLLMSTGPVTAEGKIIHVGGRLATADARLTDAAGKLYAHGSTTCMIFPVGDKPGSK
jgi:uncharacterized protein (TIGR00369 family)